MSLSGSKRAAMYWLALAVLACFSTACGPSRVQVDGEFPTPLVQPLPITLGVWMSKEFREHEFVDEGKTRGDGGWVVNTGAAQTQMWTSLLNGMFQSIVWLEEEPVAMQASAGVDGVLIPSIQELQYAIPAHTNVKVYEVWMRYRFRLLSAQGEAIAEWQMSSYGKTPTAFLQSDENAVNLAAVMALRDAGANFATNFTKLPQLESWLQPYLDASADVGQ